MEIFVQALSRLVPLAFLVSLTLIGSRYLHDLVLRTRPALAKWAFAAVSVIGLIATAPYALRAALFIAARQAAVQHRWKAADLLLSGYDSWGGARTEDSLREWAYVRMNAGDWADAEQVLRLVESPSAQTAILIGLCQYYEHNASAEATLSRVPDMTATQLCIRDYLLGRIAQRRGDLPRAYRLYQKSAMWEADFFPSVYHGVRLALVKGVPPLAGSILESFLRKFPTYSGDPDVLVLRASIRRVAVPPDKEFVVVSN